MATKKDIREFLKLVKQAHLAQVRKADQPQHSKQLVGVRGAGVACQSAEYASLGTDSVSDRIYI
jgi:hypothetical protein